MLERQAAILFKGQPAGTLRETAGGGSLFTYQPGWREPIACCLPVSQREHPWPLGLHPFFQHLGPEGWLREQQARVGHLATEDDLGLLLRHGLDCIGAVGVAPMDPFVTPGPEPADAPPVNRGRTVSGVQRKLLVVADPDRPGFWRPADATGPAPFIAKFNAEHLPTLVRNEYLSLCWTAAVLGANEVTRSALGPVTGTGETALIVTRFDRNADGGKVRMEDMAQILQRPRGNNYAGKYEGSYEEVAAIIRRHSTRPAIDLGRFFRRIVAFVLVGNCDGHLKNFSLLETPAGLRLSPLYDVVNSAFYSVFDQRLALAIGDDKLQLDSVTQPVLTAFGERIGLPRRAVDQAFNEIQRGCLKAASLLVPPLGEPPDGFVNRFADVVRSGCVRIFEP
jgi:serine/threonine-protein kinase HipA